MNKYIKFINDQISNYGAIYTAIFIVVVITFLDYQQKGINFGTYIGIGFILLMSGLSLNVINILKGKSSSSALKEDIEK